MVVPWWVSWRADIARLRGYGWLRCTVRGLLDKYADQGIDAIEDVTVLKVSPLAQLGTTTELVKSFGGRAQYSEAIHNLEAELYRPAS